MRPESSAKVSVDNVEMKLSPRKVTLRLEFLRTFYEAKTFAKRVEPK